MAKTRTKEQTQSETLPDAEQPAAVPVPVTTATTNTAAEVVARPDEPAGIAWAVYPRVVRLENTSGPAHVLVMEPAGHASKVTFDRLLTDAPGRLRAALLEVRERFFSTGQGAELRQKEQRLADAEKSARDIDNALMGLHAQWRSVVSTGLDVDVSQLEQQIDQKDRELTRQRERVKVLGESLTGDRTATANALYALLRECVDRFGEDRSQKVAVLTARLRDAVQPIYAELATAALELEGVGGVTFSDQLRFLSTTAEKVPTWAGAADPATLPRFEPVTRTEDEGRAVVAALPHPAGGALPMRIKSEPHKGRRPGEVVVWDGVKMVVTHDGYLEAAPRDPEPVTAGRGELFPGEFDGVDD